MQASSDIFFWRNTKISLKIGRLCCSGGGIRSASYCLGALQRLEQAGLLDKAKLILGVSGGSYVAASRALVAIIDRRVESAADANSRRDS